MLQTKAVTRWPWLAALSYFCFTVFVVAYGLKNPLLNWDMIAYVASAKKIAIADKAVLHRAVYAELAAFLAEKPDVHTSLTQGPYRSVMASDAEAFDQQLPYYRMRFLYVGLMTLFEKFGVNIFFATYLISALATGAGLILLYFVFRRHIDPLALMFFPFFGLILSTPYLARSSTPDALAFIALIACVYFFIAEKWGALFVALLFSICVRSDLVILAGIILAYLIWRRPNLRRPAILVLIASAGVYSLINRYFEVYDTKMIYYSAFVRLPTRPLETQAVFGLRDYANVLVWSTKKFFLQPELQLYLAFFIPSMILYARAPRLLLEPYLQRFADVSLIMFFYIVAHFLVYPFSGNSLRYFLAPYLIGVLCFFALINPRKNPAAGS